MSRRRALGLLALPVVVVALLSPLSPVAVSSAGAEEEPSSDLLVLNVRGTANRKAGTAPDRFAYVLDVYDASNRKIGSVFDARTCTQPAAMAIFSPSVRSTAPP